MSGSGKRGGDRVLESRHLVGLFLGVVLLCGVFFTLGYVMGKTQYDGAVHAAPSLDFNSAPRARAKSKSAGAPPSSAAASNPGEWDFYGKDQAADRLPAAPKASSSSSSPWGQSSAESSKSLSPVQKPKALPAAARFRAPRVARGTIVLQVAALRHEGDALAMASMLQQKRFPSFIITPKSDRFYRVQVGPYRTERAAESARRALERAGFKVIMKR